ncbi:helix-turn-helix domain-containing protein, partial [Streptomyces spongiae]|uniref:helix-turn-helix domain-containing protein n=1 Tax=Streptomyces spongiae TaxID=565072 RepID=UPI001D15B1F4
MDTRNLSAPACAQPLNPRGITHINTPHTTRYTVVGNHLAQHRQLSLTAIGLALHIQSLPDQARVDIKTLADRFPEGETRVAAALRELKAHGYLSQVRKRLPNGRVVTHTVSYNQPQAQRPESGPVPAAPRTPPRPVSDDVPQPTPTPPTDPEPTAEPALAP